jgi:hypothetical protein
MEAILYHTKKAISILICLQILLVNLPCFSMKSNKLTVSSFVKKGSDQKEATQDSETQNLPEQEDESKDENNHFEIKIFNANYKDFALLNFQKTVFELYNSKDKIQFHPEFSTPPPKFNAA